MPNSLENTEFRNLMKTQNSKMKDKLWPKTPNSEMKMPINIS